jgi:hypothetical protein
MSELKSFKFLKPKVVFDYQQDTKWLSRDKYPRMLGDVDGDGLIDIVGFADDGGVYALQYALQFNGSNFVNHHKILDKSFSYSDGWHSQDKTPRMVSDLDNDGKADIIGFKKDSVWVAQSQENGSYKYYKVLDSFFSHNDRESQNLYPRMLGDVDGDGLLDIVGFGETNTFISFAKKNSSNGSIQYTQPQFKVMGYTIKNGGWLSQDIHPRYLADVDGDGKADIVGFGDKNVYIAFSNGNGFESAKGYSEFFHLNGGYYTWIDRENGHAAKYGRVVGDINGDGKADVVGFYTWGTIVMTSNGRGFNEPYIANYELGYDKWGKPSVNPRMLADIDGDGKADIVGFKDTKVYVSFVKTIAPYEIDIEACERYSPNIERECFEKAYNNAIKQIGMWLKKIIMSQSDKDNLEAKKRELVHAFENYKQVTPENNHKRDANKEKNENSFVSAMNDIKAMQEKMLLEEQFDEMARQELNERRAKHKRKSLTEDLYGKFFNKVEVEVKLCGVNKEIPDTSDDV